MDNLKALREYLSNLIPELKVDNLFNGYGFYKNDCMFGVYFQNNFCIRAKDDFAEYIKSKLGCLPCLSENNEYAFRLSHYYILSDDVLKNKTILLDLVDRSITQVRDEKLALKLTKQQYIRGLPNLSLKQERLLKKIGVTNVEKFRSLGAIKCFIELRKLGIDLSVNMFFNFVGALLNTHAYVIPKDIRALELEKLNKALAENNFKPLADNLIRN